MDYHRGAEVEVTTLMFSCIPLAAVIMLTMNMKKRDRCIFFPFFMGLISCSFHICLKSGEIFSLQVRIARIFNTYGPRMCLDDGRVVSNFVAQVKHLP